MKPCRLSHKVTVYRVFCQPLLDLLKDRCALDLLAIGEPYRKPPLQGWVETKLDNIQGLFIPGAVQAARRLNGLVGLRVPEIVLKLLSTKLHILLGEELLVIEPHEEREIRLLLHELRIVFPLLDDGVADGCCQIGVAPHPDGDIEVCCLCGSDIVGRVNINNPCAVIFCLMGKMGIGYPHGGKILRPSYEEVCRKPVIQGRTDPSDEGRMAARVGIAYHGRDRDELAAEESCEPF